MRGEPDVASAFPRAFDSRLAVEELAFAAELASNFDPGFPPWPKALEDASNSAHPSVHRPIRSFEKECVKFIFLLMNGAVIAFQRSADHLVLVTDACPTVGVIRKPVVYSADGYGLNLGCFLQG